METVIIREMEKDLLWKMNRCFTEDLKTVVRNNPALPSTSSFPFLLRKRHTYHVIPGWVHIPVHVCEHTHPHAYTVTSPRYVLSIIPSA